MAGFGAPLVEAQRFHQANPTVTEQQVRQRALQIPRPQGHDIRSGTDWLREVFKSFAQPSASQNDTTWNQPVASPQNTFQPITAPQNRFQSRFSSGNQADEAGEPLSEIEVIRRFLARIFGRIY